ncbi:MAG: hypothetical protein A2Z94_03045 [Gallionellales bacterium GWA2_55_18]|nr:MAG: hypothetical protein A2Z94_03045 [Gallionellales bacterium GWA2_55_18]
MKPNTTHLSALAALLLLLAALPAWADGTLTHLSGAVSVQKVDGRVLPGAAGVKVSVGDTVITGAGGYVRVEMTDGGEMVLRPDSQLRVESYKFVEAKPVEDNFIFSMLKGGLRTVTGLIGKRGNQDAYELKTQTATIGIRGTRYDIRVCQGNCGALKDGTYLAVRFGAMQVTNPQGRLTVAAGQVVYAPAGLRPVLLPRDPGIGFTPPTVIPKLDEKKKQADPAAANTPNQPRPATNGAGPANQATLVVVEKAGILSSSQQRATTASTAPTQGTPAPDDSGNSTIRSNNVAPILQTEPGASCYIQ